MSVNINQKMTSQPSSATHTAKYASYTYNTRTILP